MKKRKKTLNSSKEEEKQPDASKLVEAEPAGKGLYFIPLSKRYPFIGKWIKK